MSNNAIGTLRIVANDLDAINRLEKIMRWEDDEFFIEGLVDCESADSNAEDGFYLKDFNVIGAWTCDRFFCAEEDKDKKSIKDYSVDDEGRKDYTKPIYGTSHVTSLCNLAPLIGFGCEIFATEEGCMFCEHYRVDHNGDVTACEQCEYTHTEDGDGIVCDIDNFGKFCTASDIYGY